jgi:hypothetical protein
MHEGLGSWWLLACMWYYQRSVLFLLLVHGAIRHLLHWVAFRSRPYRSGGALVYLATGVHIGMGFWYLLWIGLNHASRSLTAFEQYFGWDGMGWEGKRDGLTWAGWSRGLT